jgi:hypothetical protein
MVALALPSVATISKRSGEDDVVVIDIDCSRRSSSTPIVLVEVRAAV